jgi:hypothetical protein
MVKSWFVSLTMLTTQHVVASALLAKRHPSETIAARNGFIPNIPFIRNLRRHGQY